MAPEKIYDLFISHGWAYDEEYNRLVSQLDAHPGFEWRNHSDVRFDPALDPVSDVGFYTLRDMLQEQMSGARCVVVFSIIRPSTRKWIQHELEMAGRLEKPIVGIKPEVETRRPQWEQLAEAAKEMVDWDIQAIVDAVKRWSL